MGEERSIRRRLGAAALLLSAGILASRLLGYVRDAVIAAQHGASSDTDVYFASFTIPDLMKYMLDGGALSVVFIPMIAAFVHTGHKERAHACFSVVATTVGAVATVITIVLWIAAPSLVPLVVPGFTPEQLELTISLTRIVLPAQIFFILGGLLNATLQADERFLEAALAPVVYNVFIIAGGVGLGPWIGIAGFSWGALVGSLGQLALFANAARRRGLIVTPRLSFTDPDLVRFVKQSIPVLLGFSLFAADEWISRYFASGMAEGSISWIQNARRLMLVPVTVLGFATGQAALPYLSRLHTEGKPAEAAAVLADTIRIVVFVTLAASAWIAVSSEPIIGLFYERKAFTAVDTVNSAAALILFSPGIVFWALYALVGRGFYAMQDTLTPMVVATAAMLASIPAYRALGEAMGHRGLALGTSLGMALTIAALLMALQRKCPLPLKALGLSALRSALVAAGGGAAAIAASALVPATGYVLPGLVGSVGFAGGILLMIALLKPPEWATLIGRLRRPRAAG